MSEDNAGEANKAVDVTNSKINQLLEYETMVTSAENKCTQLKGELERMKQLYNNQTARSKTAALKTQKTGLRRSKGKLGIYIEPTVTKSSISKIKLGKMVRQNSHRIGTDTSGAALGTINNILAGITRSIHLFDLNKSKPQELNKTKLDPGKHQLAEPIFGVEDVKIHSKSKSSLGAKSSAKPQVKTARSKITSKTSSTVFKRTRKSVSRLPNKQTKESRAKLNVGTIAVTNRNKQTGKPMTKFTPRLKPRTTDNQDLVEIYHNKAVKECRSSESEIPKRKNEQITNNKEETEPQLDKIIPPLNINPNENKVEEADKGVVSCINKSYTLPTISSRMKRVAKYYMSSFNIKTIPFCPATSTSASHNIGINIQQVMSMVKNKQLTGQLSPTLAYNIALAADKWEKNPLSILVSNATSRTIYSHCPLSKSTINYQHLQEMAKNIQQESIEEVDENDDATKSPETQSIIITGPSGDVKVTNRKQTTWTANANEKKCTCIPQKGLEIQQIINKFNGTVSATKINKMPTFSSKVNKPKTSEVQEAYSHSIKQTTENTPLQNKEKKLKEVLAKLHDEFEKMTLKYEELAKKNEEGAENPELVKELENLDKDLNNKEEEIVMVMTLYKEVLALKDQVKALKERSSKELVCVKACPPKLVEYNNVTTAGLLNKLLHRIQHFQTHYKKH